MTRSLPYVLGFLALAAPAVAQDPFAGLPRAQVMLLGTFHFDDPGLDDYKPQFPWDPFTSEHQREIEEVVARLVRYAPTRIALEWPASRQAGLDSLYAAFLAGAAPMANERQQLGFRIARELGHERVYAIDAPGRSYFPDMTQEEYDARAARLGDSVPQEVRSRQFALDLRYTRLYRMEDSLKTTMPLRETLLYANDPESLRIDHGAYLIGGFRLGSGDDYLGADIRTSWYNRNLRIFQNIQRITASQEDRILVIIGAGHLPIIRQAVEASPEFELLEVADFLGG